MSIIEFKYYELDEAIDKRIVQSNDIRNEWGTNVFDSEGRLQNNEDFPLDRHTLLGIIQHQQEQITRQSKKSSALRVSDGINSSAIEMLLERVKVLENNSGVITGQTTLIQERVKVLEKEVEKL